jgi:hypothetical protein
MAASSLVSAKVTDSAGAGVGSGAGVGAGSRAGATAGLAQADRKSRTMITIGIQRLFMNSILLWAVRYVKRNDGKLIP